MFYLDDYIVALKYIACYLIDWSSTSIPYVTFNI